MKGLVNVPLVDADHQQDLVEFYGVDAVVNALVEGHQGEGKFTEFVV